MSESSIADGALRTSKWLDPRRPLIFISQGIVFYVSITTLGQTLWSYLGRNNPDAITISEIAGRAFANLLTGIIFISLLWYRSKKKLESLSD